MEHIGNVSEYFKFEYEPEWLEDEFVRRIIKEIDNTEVRSDGTLFSHRLGPIIYTQLSTGCKALILIHKTDIKINGDRMGDNCVPLLLEICERKDVEIALHHLMQFPDNFKALVLNSNKIITSHYEFLTEYLEYR